MWRYQRHYGYIKKSRHSHQKWKGLVFIGVYLINRILHGLLEIRNFSSRVKKYFTRSLRSLLKYCSTLEEKFRISARSCNILYLGHQCCTRSREFKLLDRQHAHEAIKMSNHFLVSL